MAKRKRQMGASEVAPETTAAKKARAVDNIKETKTTTTTATETIQLVAGSYDRVLHGFTAAIADSGTVSFADTFLFNAHASAIRCVAVSPPSAPIPGQGQKVFLASGSSDERVQVYSLSAHPTSEKRRQSLAHAGSARPIHEDPRNRSLGTLLHHTSTVTSLSFPTRSKLISGSDDSTMAVTRTRDLAVLSTIRAPRPKAVGRPSGDTAAFGTGPSGVNGFAVHPSMKLMISVGKGERCMRLWNLVTGRKAGVLGFGREVMGEVGGGRYGMGEGRGVVWGCVGGGDEFAVGFDRGCVVYGMDSVVRCVVAEGVKMHRFEYVDVRGGKEGGEKDNKKEGMREKVEEGDGGDALLAVATEDGRIVFFSTREEDLQKGEGTLPKARKVAQVGGGEDGVGGRIKDFLVVRSEAGEGRLYVVGASSDGRVRVWRVMVGELEKGGGGRVGELVGTYETHNRITCLTGFLMVARPEGVEDDDEGEDEEGEDEEEEDE